MTPPTDDFERRLRATLARHAREAPPGAPLADRILLELDSPVLRPRHGWRVWAAPLLAAAAIAAAALALVGVSNAHLGAAPAPAATRLPSSTPTPTSTPSPLRVRPPHGTLAPTTVTSRPPVAPTGSVRGFRADDVSFDSPTEGWALGSADCARGSSTRCTVLLHTTDGTHWAAASNGTPFHTPDGGLCAEPCVTHVRFAGSTVGYAYGRLALFMTTDGGAHWTRQPGLGADVLETLDGNVILVRAGGPGSVAPLFRRAVVGGSTWTSFSVAGFPGVPQGGSVQLSRAYGVTLLTVTGYDAYQLAASPGAVFGSVDGGATWQQIAHPCGSRPVGHWSIAGAVVGAGDGSMVIDCAVQTRTDPGGVGTTFSAARGSTQFVRAPSGGKVAPAILLAAPTRDVQLVRTRTGDLYRSTDAGHSWDRLAQPNGVTFLGFNSGTEARALGDDSGHTLWTTTDAGATWHAVVFSA